jgi:hypothetical protein
LSTIYFVYLSTFGEVTMVRKVIRPSGRPRVTIRYRKTSETPIDVQLAIAEPAARIDGPSPPPWHDLLIKIAELPDFKARWGLVTVYAAWPEEIPCPIVYLVEA